jgi:hypothetical protein
MKNCSKTYFWDLRVNSVAMATDTPLFSALFNFSRFFLSEYIWVILRKND